MNAINVGQSIPTPSPAAPPQAAEAPRDVVDLAHTMLAAVTPQVSEDAVRQLAAQARSSSGLPAAALAMLQSSPPHRQARMGEAALDALSSLPAARLGLETSSAFNDERTIAHVCTTALQHAAAATGPLAGLAVKLMDSLNGPDVATAALTACEFLRQETGGGLAELAVRSRRELALNNSRLTVDRACLEALADDAPDNNANLCRVTEDVMDSLATSAQDDAQRFIEIAFDLLHERTVGSERDFVHMARGLIRPDVVRSAPLRREIARTAMRQLEQGIPPDVGGRVALLKTFEGLAHDEVGYRYYILDAGYSWAIEPAAEAVHRDMHFIKGVIDNATRSASLRTAGLGSALNAARTAGGSLWPVMDLARAATNMMGEWRPKWLVAEAVLELAAEHAPEECDRQRAREALDAIRPQPLAEDRWKQASLVMEAISTAIYQRAEVKRMASAVNGTAPAHVETENDVVFINGMELRRNQ